MDAIPHCHSLLPLKKACDCESVEPGSVSARASVSNVSSSVNMGTKVTSIKIKSNRSNFGACGHISSSQANLPVYLLLKYGRSQGFELQSSKCLALYRPQQLSLFSLGLIEKQPKS